MSLEQRTTDNMNTNEQYVLQPLKKWHERKTFASSTLKQIKSRLQYYRKILNQPVPSDATSKMSPTQLAKKIAKRNKIQRKYDHNIKVRKLLNRAINNLYI